MSSAAGQPFDLPSLDDVRAIELAPEILENNLAALARVAPHIARLAKECAIPAHWQAALGLDDAHTFRIEQPGQPAQWLGNTAAPRRRAEALLEPQKLANANILLPSAATGAEPTYLLHSLPPHQAVFIAEVDPLRIAVILRLYDLSSAINNGRVYFLVGEDISAYLVETLARTPGLLAPSLIINLPDQSAARIEDLRAQCERAARISAESRATRMTEIAEAAPSFSKQSATPRLGVLALTAEPRVWRLADQLVAAGLELGWAAESFCLNAPVRVHPLAQSEWLAAFGPTQLILCDTRADKIALKSPAHISSLSHSPDKCRDDAGAGRHLSLSPRHDAALRAAGVAPARIVEFPWSVSRVSQPAKIATTIDVLFLGDRGSLAPASLGIDQTTLELVWNALQKVAFAKWADKESSKPEALLREAERFVGFDLSDKSMRERFLGLIERVLIPTASLAEIEKLATQTGLRSAAVGNGWSHGDRPAAPAFATVGEAVQAGMIPRLAIATLLPDGLRQDGIDALAHGFPLALHIPPAIRPSDFLPAGVAGSNCFVSLGSKDEWRIFLSDLGKREQETTLKADAARRLVKSEYLWSRTLQQLV